MKANWIAGGLLLVLYLLWLTATAPARLLAPHAAARRTGGAV